MKRFKEHVKEDLNTIERNVEMIVTHLINKGDSP